MSAASSHTENLIFENTATAGITAPQRGKPIEIGTGFSANTFRERDFASAMDPLVMVDHYRMSESTFGAHPHAGLSAVSVLFEDSKGKFHNRDSLGNDFDLMPGDLYWLKAGSGAVHDEAPRTGAIIHGLQVFVNLPARMKQDTPESLHVKAKEMPVLESNRNRVRVVLGESNGMTGKVSPSLPMTILDGKIAAGSSFAHDLRAGEHSWVYAVSGEIKLVVGGEKVKLEAGESIAIKANSHSATKTIALRNCTDSEAHFALFAALPVKEAFAQKGPFVMNNEAEIARVEAEYAAGKLGSLK